MARPTANQDDENLDGLLAQGRELAEGKQYARALAVFERVTTLDPHLARAWNNKGAAVECLQAPAIMPCAPQRYPKHS